MNLISRIIAKEWIKSLIGAVIVLFLLVSIGDIVNGFLRNFSASRVLIEYFLKLPDLTGKMLPISTLLASLFAVNRLKAHSELMAILAGGYSAQIIYRLILICSLGVAFLQFMNLGFVVPAANKVKRQEFEKSRNNESKYLARSKIGDGGLVWYKTDKYFTSFAAYDRRNKTLKGISLYYIDDDNQLKEVYNAKAAVHLSKNTWELRGVSILGSLKSEGYPVINTKNTVEIELEEEPSDFGQFESDITTLNFLELGHFINRLNATDINSTEYEIMYFEKISLVLICIVFSVFPLYGVFTPNRRAAGFGKNVVLTLLFSIFFWGIHSMTISMGNSGKIPVLVATLAIPIVFSVIILFVFLKNKRL